MFCGLVIALATPRPAAMRLENLISGKVDEVTACKSSTGVTRLGKSTYHSCRLSAVPFESEQTARENGDYAEKNSRATPLSKLAGAVQRQTSLLPEHCIKHINKA